MATTAPPHILYLTTHSPASNQQHQECPVLYGLQQRNARVTVLSWLDPDLQHSAKLADFDLITVLGIDTYHRHANAFAEFLARVLLPATRLYPAIRVVNPAPLVLWNYDKRYLLDLKREGFCVPVTLLADADADADANANAGAGSNARNTVRLSDRVRGMLLRWEPAGACVVIKPSISASSKGTYLVQNASALSDADEAFLAALDDPSAGRDGTLLLQKYEPAIKRGEYSVISLDGEYTHTVLKTPKTGEFRCQHRFGGSAVEVPREQVPPVALRTAAKLVKLLETRFCMHGERLPYVRVDGVIREGTGEFVLMECEGIEPELWLQQAEAAKGGERLFRALLEADASN